MADGTNPAALSAAEIEAAMAAAAALTPEALALPTPSESAPAPALAPSPEAVPSPSPFVPVDFGAAATASGGAPTQLDLLDDVELEVKIELGRTEMYIEDVLRLGVGSVVELNKLAGDPVEVYVNDRLVARGEVLVLNENFCVRVNHIVSVTAEIEGN